MGMGSDESFDLVLGQMQSTPESGQNENTMLEEQKEDILWMRWFAG